MASGVKPQQRRLDLLHRVFRLHRFIEKPFRLRQARPAAPATLGHPDRDAYTGHLGVGLTRRLQLTLGLLPLSPQHAFKLALAMKHVKAHGDRLALAPRLVAELGLAPFIG
jgi:hypothetical protein